MSGPKINHSKLLVGLFALTSLTSCFSGKDKKTDNPFPQNTVENAVYDRREGITKLNLLEMDENNIAEATQIAKKSGATAEKHGLSDAQVIEALEHIDEGKLSVSSVQSEVQLLQFDGKEMKFLLDVLNAKNTKSVQIDTTDPKHDNSDPVNGKKKFVEVAITDQNDDRTVFVYGTNYSGTEKDGMMDQIVTGNDLVQVQAGKTGQRVYENDISKIQKMKEEFHVSRVQSSLASGPGVSAPRL